MQIIRNLLKLISASGIWVSMFTALKLLGKPTAFVQVEGENHHILDYDKRILWNNTIYAWFAKWLKDQPEWWDALYPPKSL